jgi:hypothetical protein
MVDSVNSVSAVNTVSAVEHAALEDRGGGKDYDSAEMDNAALKQQVADLRRQAVTDAATIADFNGTSAGTRGASRAEAGGARDSSAGTR